MKTKKPLEAAIEPGSRIALAVLLVFGAGCGGTAPAPRQESELVQGVQLQRIRFQDLPEEWEAPGSVIAFSTAQVAARITGVVSSVGVREGDLVKRGQLLARLDERELVSRSSAARAGAEAARAGTGAARQALAEAQAQAEIMKKTLDRYAFLNQEKSVSPQEFDEVSARQQSAQARLEQARAGLRQAESVASQAEFEFATGESLASYARVLAPFDGKVARRTVEAGSLVSPGTPLFVIEAGSRYQLEVTLPAQASGSVRKGATVRVELESAELKSLSGRVAEMEAGADPTSHTLKTRVDLPERAGVVSGLFGRAFFFRQNKRALLVPLNSIVNRGQLSGVYSVDQTGLIRWRVVTLGKPRGDQQETLSGLADGDLIVRDPPARELDGKLAPLLPAVGEKRL